MPRYFKDNEDGRVLEKWLIKRGIDGLFKANVDSDNTQREEGYDDMACAFLWTNTPQGEDWWREQQDAFMDFLDKSATPTTLEIAPDDVLEQIKEIEEEEGIKDLVINVSEETIKTEAAYRKEQPVYSGFLKYFPHAVKEVANASFKGNEQHHPDKPLHWDMSKSKDEGDALVRHLIDHSVNPIDVDGVRHLSKVAWRAMAMLERELTQNY